MPTYIPIFTRSPRMIEQTGSTNDAIVCKVYLWNSPSAAPVTPNYTLSKPILSNSTSAWFDISPYCREFISHSVFTEVTTLTAAPVTEYSFCKVEVLKNAVLQTTYDFICFDGYGYFEDGYNKNYVKGFLEDGTYYVSDTGNSGSLYYHNDLTVTWEAVYTGLVSGSTTVTLTHEAGLVPYVHSSYVGQGNTLEIKRNSVIVSTYKFVEVCEPKYEVLNCDFVNKFGSWQRLVFFKASSKTLETNSNEFFVMPDSPNYSVTENRKKVFNVNGIQTIKANTGNLVESYSNVIKELLLSETIRINNEPVKLRTKSTKLFKHINEKTINYEIEFEYANNVLNYSI